MTPSESMTQTLTLCRRLDVSSGNHLQFCTNQ